MSVTASLPPPTTQPRASGAGPAIWLGDALRAISTLGADEDTAAAVLRLLQLVPASEVPAPVPFAPPVPTRPRRSALEPGRPRSPTVAPPGHVPDSPWDVGPTAGPPRRPVLETLGTAVTRPPEALPALGSVLPEPAVRALPSADLLSPRTQRSLLSALCGAPAQTREIDVPATAELLLEGRPLVALPMLVRSTTRRGTQLLVDIGEAMIPFARDTDDLRRAITLVAGADGLDVRQFRANPLAEDGAGAGPVWTWRPYRPPPAGRPVIVVSDFGCLRAPDTRAAVQRDWRRFALLLAESGTPVVGLAPLPRSRLPVASTRLFPVVPWDRGTRVQDAVLAMRKAVR